MLEPTELKLNVREVTIVRGNGADKIGILIDGPSPYPELEQYEPGNYPPLLKIECRHGYAEEWLRRIGIAEFEMIEV